MPARNSLTVALLALGLAAFAGEAAAQSVFPAPYSYPPGGYRGVPSPDDDDVITAEPADPDVDIRPNSPGARTLAPGPGLRDPRLDRQAAPDVPPPPERYGNRSLLPPLFGPLPPFDERQPAESAGRPDDAVQSPLRPPADIGAVPATPGSPPQSTLASLPPDDQPEEGEPQELPPQFKRQVVDYLSKEPAGTIIIDTASTYLYYTLGNGQAVRYGIGVGRDGFTWAGTEKISKMAEWPDWHPPAEMIERQPYLPRFMAGGPGNPLGARALYLGKTVYRIHGTNQPSTIGKFVSSGCIRMLNEDVEDLYSHVKLGTRVVVLAGTAPASAAITR